MSETRNQLRAILYGTTYGAIFVILLGLYFLLQNFGLLPDNWDIGKLWPLVLIVPGIVFLVNRTKDSTKK